MPREEAADQRQEDRIEQEQDKVEAQRQRGGLSSDLSPLLEKVCAPAGYRLAC